MVTQHSPTATPDLPPDVEKGLAELAKKAAATPGGATGQEPAGKEGAGKGAPWASTNAADPAAIKNEKALSDDSAKAAAFKAAADIAKKNVGTAGGETKPSNLPTGADKTGVSSQAISVPQGSGKIQGMGESFSAQLSTGIATFSVPFALPDARGAAKASLGLSYSSSGGHGLAGLGWDIGWPYIARQTDRGLPKYDDQADWHPEQDRFVYNGGQELVPICTVQGTSCDKALDGEKMPAWADSWQYFRPRVEGSFLRFFWSHDHLTWRVQDKSGVVMELGVARAVKGDRKALETDPSGTKIFRWNLAVQYDQELASPAEGDNDPGARNAVSYQYEQHEGMAYLADIFLTSSAKEPTSSTFEKYAHHVHLAYEERSDPTISFRRGWPVRSTLRLKGVDVASKPHKSADAPRAMVRRYHLSYDSLHPSLLSSVQVEGRCEGTGDGPNADDSAHSIVEDGAGHLPASTSCPKLPAMTFRYQHVTPYHGDGSPGVADLKGYEGFDERVRKLAGSPDHSLDEELTDLFDVNSDGLPDVLVTAPGLYQGGHGLFLNGAGGTPDSFGSPCTMKVAGVLGADASVISLKNSNVSPQDLDGDGIIDLLHMPKVKTYSVYTPSKQGKCGKEDRWVWAGREITTAAAQSPKIDFGKDAADLRVLDANGDGLVDVVRITGTEVQTYFSLGRYPGGDGQFGHATWTGAETASLSNDPVAHCVPWSGSPAHFSDADIKLADMNGDGLTDLVRLRKGEVRYWPGRGNGMFGTGGLDDCPGGTFGQDRSVAMSDSPQFADPDGTELRVDDINGDGLDDLVQVRFNAIDVWLNVDGTGWTQNRHIAFETPINSPLGHRVRLVDINGSGTRDILFGDGNAYKYIDLLGGERPWVLTRVQNGLGKSTELEYASSVSLMLAAKKAGNAWSSTTPSPMHVVVKSTERDHLDKIGRPAGVYVTEYIYRDPVFDGRQREFRGFSHAESKRLGDANSPTSISISEFLLGECKKEPNDSDDICSYANRWRDNHREALKGLPRWSETIDEKGVSPSLSHHTYTLRKLYTGLDGRQVRHAFESASDSFLFDTAPFAGPPSDASLPEVVLEAGAGSVTDTDAKVHLRGAGPAQIHGSVEVDVFGNRTSSTAAGCISGCLTADETITSYTTAGRPDDDPTGWMWRTTSSFVSSLDSGARHSTSTKYDSRGRPVETRFYLSGSLPLQRFHEGMPVNPPNPPPDPPPPPMIAKTPDDASADSPSGGTLASEVIYDNFGQPLLSWAVGDRCRSISYDEAFGDLPEEEVVYAGTTTAPVHGKACGTTQLKSKVLAYDRGLGLTLLVEGLHHEPTKAVYDGFGRITELVTADPTPVTVSNTTTCQLGTKPSVKIEYLLTTQGECIDGKGDSQTCSPVSLMHTSTQDGVSPGDEAYHEAWAYVDGMGRTIVTLSEADPTEDGAPWIAQGLAEYDAKGAAKKAYLPWFYTDPDPTKFPMETVPATAYGRQRYDAFGRQVETYGIDGTVTLRSRYHALSTDAWDAADIAPGPHQGTYASSRKDGHGRALDAVERIHVAGKMEERHTLTSYLPSGEVSVITRHRGPLGMSMEPDVVRWMRYDSQGRMVLNVEPSTSKNFTPTPALTGDVPQDLRAWRYVYNDAGDLVGTSDARGCGSNYHYDHAGRLIAEDYSPCKNYHQPYTEPDLTSGDRTEVFTRYDLADGDEGNVGQGFTGSIGSLAGRVASVSDRGSKVMNQWDCRGRVTAVAKRITKPGETAPALADRYAPRWYVQRSWYDGADRPIYQTTGVQSDELKGLAIPEADNERSVVATRYTARGAVKSVGGSYDRMKGMVVVPLVQRVNRDAEGKTLKVIYGDLANTTTEYTYDDRRRVKTVQTYRGPPPCWTADPPPPECQGYSAKAARDAGVDKSFQLLLEDTDFSYDVVDNPTEIRDWRVPSEWPDGAKPVIRRMEYDDLYRLRRIDYEYKDGDDKWVSPFEHENNTPPPSAGQPDPLDPRLARPSPHVAFDKRILWQTYAFDWLGNTSATYDDADGFYDRSLGTIQNGTASAGPYQLRAASNGSSGGAAPRQGSLAAKYDDAGNLVGLAVNRNTTDGLCLGGTACNQRLAYEWDEVGRLNRARRWDSTAAVSMEADLPSEGAAAELWYLYDGSDQRVVKTAVDSAGHQLHTAYVFRSVELRRTAWAELGATAFDYDSGSEREVGCLFAPGMRLARLHYEPSGVPEVGSGSMTKLHVLLELGDHLGSTSSVIDKATGELAEKGTYQPFGAAESDFRPVRWKGLREDYRFTGKEDDAEIGLSYFGRRFLSSYLGRWASADPLAVQAPGGADPNVYAYVHGSLLRAVDPVGLTGCDGQNCTPTQATPSGPTASVCDGGSCAPPSPEVVGELAWKFMDPKPGPTFGSADHIEQLKSGGDMAGTPAFQAARASPPPPPASPAFQMPNAPALAGRDLIAAARRSSNGVEAGIGYGLGAFMTGVGLAFGQPMSAIADIPFNIGAGAQNFRSGDDGAGIANTGAGLAGVAMVMPGGGFAKFSTTEVAVDANLLMSAFEKGRMLEVELVLEGRAPVVPLSAAWEFAKGGKGSRDAASFAERVSMLEAWLEHRGGRVSAAADLYDAEVTAVSTGWQRTGNGTGTKLTGAKMKLPDAFVLATAEKEGLKVFTWDAHLQNRVVHLLGEKGLVK